MPAGAMLSRQLVVGTQAGITLPFPGMKLPAGFCLSFEGGDPSTCNMSG